MASSVTCHYQSVCFLWKSSTVGERIGDKIESVAWWIWLRQGKPLTPMYRLHKVLTSLAAWFYYGRSIISDSSMTSKSQIWKEFESHVTEQGKVLSTIVLPVNPLLELLLVSTRIHWWSKLEIAKMDTDNIIKTSQ